MKIDDGQSIEAQPPSDRELRDRKVMRVGMSVWAIGGGLIFVLFFDGWSRKGVGTEWH